MERSSSHRQLTQPLIPSPTVHVASDAPPPAGGGGGAAAAAVVAPLQPVAGQGALTGLQGAVAPQPARVDGKAIDRKAFKAWAEPPPEKRSLLQRMFSASPAAELADAEIRNKISAALGPRIAAVAPKLSKELFNMAVSTIAQDLGATPTDQEILQAVIDYMPAAPAAGAGAGGAAPAISSQRFAAAVDQAFRVSVFNAMPMGSKQYPTTARAYLD